MPHPSQDRDGGHREGGWILWGWGAASALGQAAIYTGSVLSSKGLEGVGYLHSLWARGRPPPGEEGSAPPLPQLQPSETEWPRHHHHHHPHLKLCSSALRRTTTGAMQPNHIPNTGVLCFFLSTKQQPDWDLWGVGNALWSLPGFLPPTTPAPQRRACWVLCLSRILSKRKGKGGAGLAKASDSCWPRDLGSRKWHVCPSHRGSSSSSRVVFVPRSNHHRGTKTCWVPGRGESPWQPRRQPQ